MFFFVLLPITGCLANVSNSSQPSNTTKIVPESDFIWVPPPTVKWPRITHHHHPHPPKQWRPFPMHGPSFPFSPLKFFPDQPPWFHSRHKRFHPPHHHHHHHGHGPHHHHHDHHHDFHPHFDFHHPFPVNEMIPTDEIFEASVPYQRKEDMIKINGSEGMEFDSQILSTMEKLMSEKLNDNVEILKSIEMEYDPVLKKFVQKLDEAAVENSNSHPQKKRSDASETALFSPKTKQNLYNVLSKFEKEQSNEGIAMRDKKNFQTGRFKSKYDHKVKVGSNPNAPPPSNTSKNNLLELICNVKYSGPKMDSIPSATVRPDRFSRNANYYKMRNSDLSQKGDDYTDWENNSISVYVDDPKFFNFLHGNWSKGGVPIMLTAMNPNNKGHDHTNCNPG